MRASGKFWRVVAIGCLAAVLGGVAQVSFATQAESKDKSAADDRAASRILAGVRLSGRAKRVWAQTPASAERTAGPKGRINRVDLTWKDDSGRGGVLNGIDGCISAGPGIDVLWRRNQLFLMKKKGHLSLVCEADGPNGRFSNYYGGGTSVCFDGRYVWAAVTRREAAPLLVVLDPQSDKTWTLDAKDGLPTRVPDPQKKSQEDSYLSIGAVAPGKACVAASQCSLPLAIVEFDPEKGASVKPIPLPQASADSPTAAGLAPVPTFGSDFRPRAICKLSAPAAQGDKPLHRIMVSYTGNANRRPLLIDPDTLAVETSAENEIVTPICNGKTVVHEGAIYWLMSLPYDTLKDLVLTRATTPNLEEELVLDKAPKGSLLSFGDRLAFFGEKCWLWKPGETKLESVDIEMPWIPERRREPPDPETSPRIAGEIWYLHHVFASENYGALVSVVKDVGPNRFSGEFLLLQFALADDPRAKPEPPPPPKPTPATPSQPAQNPELASDVPAGTAASELRLFAAKADDQPPKAMFGKAIEGRVDGKFRYPILAREIVRQALLIAARDELQWSTRDGTLSEAVDAEGEPAASYILFTRFPYAGAAEFDLQKVADELRTMRVWQEAITLNEKADSPLDYARLVEAAERWSREAFPGLLRQGDLKGEPNAASDGARLPDATEERLEQMSFIGQFAAVRELHRAMRQDGESDALLGALTRGYANLGVMSEFHWNSMHKACKARALLYAQRLVARSPKSAEALWHRAYAKALTGLHDSAVADLDAALELHEASGEAGESPRWVSIIDAFCRFRTNELGAFAERGEYSQLAGLLQFFHLESLKESAAVQILAQQLVERNPEDFRLLDALCECCAISTLHGVTQLAPAVLHQVSPLRLKTVSGVPAAAAKLLPGNAERGNGLTELADALAGTPAEDDREEFSWRILGRMLQETEFIQLWRRVYFMRYQWAVPTEEFIDAIAKVATGHRYRPLIELCSTDARRWQAAAEKLVDRMELEELDFIQQGAFEKALGRTWQSRWTEQYVAAERRPILHADDVCRDLLQQLEKENWSASNGVVERLLKVSSGSPDAAATQLRQRRNPTAEQIAELEKKFPYSPQVWKALSETVGDVELQRRVLQTYIKLSPDMWAYQRLANQFRKQGKMDEWKATLDECLEQPAFGLEHANLRVQIANYYMDRLEWEKAKPYAEEAAESWAEWAMLCAIRCYRGLGDDENEGVWRTRVAERYPKTSHSLDLYVWSRRTGLGDADQLFRAIEPAVAAAAQKTSAESQFMVGLFYHLGKQPGKALAAYRKGCEGNPNARSLCFSNLWAATLAQELGEVEVRDQCLERIAQLKDAKVAHFRKLAEWLQTMLAGDKQQRPDLAAAREIAAAAVATDRTGVNCFLANFLDLTGRKDDALTFYRAAIDDPAAHFTATYAYVCATLRDRGLMPEADADEPEEGKSEEPAKEPPAESETK